MRLNSKGQVTIPAFVVGDQASRLERMGQESLYHIYRAEFSVAVTQGVALIRPVVSSQVPNIAGIHA